VKWLMGSINADSGEVRVGRLGDSPGSPRDQRHAHSLGMVISTSTLVENLTVLENLVLPRANGRRCHRMVEGASDIDAFMKADGRSRSTRSGWFRASLPREKAEASNPQANSISTQARSSS